MKTEIQFRDFAPEPHLRDFINDLLMSSLGRFEAWRDFDVQVFVKEDRHRNFAHPPIFQVELKLKALRQSSNFLVKKSNVDFYRCVRDAVDTCERGLRRASKIRVAQRRRNHLPLHSQLQGA